MRERMVIKMTFFAVVNYNSMPKMFKMDNFEECSKSLQPMEFPKQYCIMHINLVPQDNDKPIKDIKKFSQSKKFRFDHTILKHGVCFSNCINLHTTLKDKFTDYLNDNTVVSEAPIAKGRLLMMNKLANVCINKELMDLYGVKAKTSIDYCVYDDLTNENYNRLFYVAVLLSIFMFTLAGIYEIYKDRPRISKKLEYWKCVRRYLTAFSIKQNWQALIADNSPNLELDNELHLSKLYAIKVVMMFLFVLNQVYRQIISMPFANPIHIEKVSTRDNVTVMVLNAILSYLFFSTSTASVTTFLMRRASCIFSSQSVGYTLHS
jgi:hypothetical protein